MSRKRKSAWKACSPRRARPDVDMEALGERIAMRKEALQKEIEAQGLPGPETTTLEEVQL